MTRHGEPVAVGELVQEVEMPAPVLILTAAGVPSTSDAETDAVLNDFPDTLEQLNRLKRGGETSIPAEEVARQLGLKLQ